VPYAPDGNANVDSSPANVRRACRCEPWPSGIEQSISIISSASIRTFRSRKQRAMAELGFRGQVRTLGCRKPARKRCDERRRSIHRGVQSEYSLWTRDVETTCTSHLPRTGNTFVRTSARSRILDGRDPKTRGPRSERLAATNLASERQTLRANLRLLKPLRRRRRKRRYSSAISARVGASQGEDMVPIPGTKRVRS